jgi:hypothetical protein
MVNDLFYSALFTLLTLYAWAAICFFFFRFSRAETESRMRDFLKTYHKFFSGRAYNESGKSLTKKTIRKASLWGWLFLPFAFFHVHISDLNYERILTSIGILFFPGLCFALGWYGIRCLRLLGLDSYHREE